MNTNTNAPNRQAADTEPLKPETLIEQLRIWQQQIPEFTQVPLTGSARTIAKITRLNPDFTQQALDAIDSSSLIEQAVGRPTSELREDLAEADRWSSVEGELKTLLDGITAANRVRRHRVGNSLLQAYHFSVRLARQKEHEALVPRVREMKRTPKFGVRKRAKTAETPPDAPKQQKT